MLLTKKTILGVPKSVRCYDFPRLSTASLSTAYERAEGSNAVAEGSSEDGAMKREDMYEVKQEELAMSNDAAKDGPIKAVEGADMVRDSAKESMDGAWMAAQETAHKVRDKDKKD
ncbi:unnamed protein product [Sphenostylis stenocarpa]|uniref:Uncharacterized protein n=1 Tax=Sphenostylis stenocarpa TaxID=92480 RepID=A0AA86VID3_9FABA|nr:unnamed protein product [Sphenostylis stenocarpa]